MSQFGSDFQYSIRRSAAYGVVIFTGPLAVSGLAELEKCRAEIAAAPDFKGLVIDFARVTTIAAEAIPLLALIQRTIRTNKIELRLCGLTRELVEKLDKKGVVRKSEIASDVREALALLVANGPDKFAKA